MIICLVAFVIDPQLRFQTCASTAGTERMAISCSRPDAGLAPRIRLSSGDVAKSAKGLLAPHDLVFVKGWTRSVCANIVMCCAYENPSFLEVRRFSVSCLPSRSGASA